MVRLPCRSERHSEITVCNRDAWSKRKDLDSYEAKWLYVDELLKVLRKPEYNDKPIAQELISELEAFGTGTSVRG